MQEKKSLRQQLAMWANGQEEHCHGFFDWFCQDKALPDRAKKLQARVRNFLKQMEAKGRPVDLDRHYVFFKNNCPFRGYLYDSFSICNLEEGEVRYWVAPKSGHTGKSELWISSEKREIQAERFNELFAQL
jgi:hypothetical protein